MLTRYKVLVAMYVLEQFTVADLARYCESPRSSVRSVINRERWRLNELSRDDSVPKKATFVYQVPARHLDSLRSEIRELESRARAEAQRNVANSKGRIPNPLMPLLTAEGIIIYDLPSLRGRDARQARIKAAKNAIEAAELDCSIMPETEISESFRLRAATARTMLEIAQSQALEYASTGEIRSLLARVQTLHELNNPLAGQAESLPSKHAANSGVASTAAAHNDRPGALHLPVHKKRIYSRLVGRESEMAVLRSRLDEVRAKGSAYLQIVSGQAGLGKTRLSMEFSDSVSESTIVLNGRCLPYGSGVTFWPLARMISYVAQIASDDNEEDILKKIGRLLIEEPDQNAIIDGLAPIVGAIGPMASQRESFWAVSRLLTALAKKMPVLLCFDDAQWAEPELINLLKSVAQDSLDRPILIVVITNKLEAVESLRAVDNTLEVMALDEISTAQVCEEMVGDHTITKARQRQIIDTAQGNPLYLEQVLNLYLDQKSGNSSSKREEGRVDRLIRERHLASIELAIDSRISALTGPLRQLLSHASIMGQVFYREALPDLLRADVNTVDELLESLILQDFIEPASHSAVSNSLPYAFHHSTICRRAYSTLTRGERVKLHVRFADWLSSRTINTAARGWEFVGFHLEEASKNAENSDKSDYSALRERAGAALIEAAGLVKEADSAAARKMLSRASMMLSGDNPLYTTALIELGLVQIDAHDYANALITLQEARKLAEAGQNISQLRNAEVLLLRVLAVTAPEQQRPHEIEDSVARALGIFHEYGDHVGAARAWRTRATLSVAQGLYEEASWSLDRSLFELSNTKDVRETRRVRRARATLLSWGAVPAREALRRASSLLRRADSDRGLQRELRSQLAILYALLDDRERAIDNLLSARSLLLELDSLSTSAGGWFAAFVEGRVYSILNEFTPAKERLLNGVETMEGSPFYRPHYVLANALLADILAETGESLSARQCIVRVTDRICETDVAARVRVALVEAKLSLAGELNLKRAEYFLEEASQAASRMAREDLDTRAELLLVWSRVHEAGGNLDQARTCRGQARQLYWVRENIAAARRMGN